MAVIRSQAVAQGALGPKLTEGVSGSESGHDPTSPNFRVPVGRPHTQHGDRGGGQERRALQESLFAESSGSI